MRYPLRPYQVDLKNQVKKLFSSGIKHVILCSPTGSGKTVTFADIALSAVKNGSRVMIVVDRTELLEQAKEKLISYGLNPSTIANGKTVRQGQNCYVATVQTLVRRKIPEIDFLIIDEAHKQSFDKLITEEYYKDKFILGATATPKRTGKMKQLSDSYGAMVETVDVPTLIEMGFLTPAISYGAEVDTSNIKMRGSDFDSKDMFKAFDKMSLYNGVVEKYNKLTPGTKAICFNVNVEHSIKTTEAFNRAGIRSAHIDGKTPKALRKSLLQQFSVGIIQVLNNVDVLTTGYDEWSIETVIINRATKSLPLFLQMAGRGSRIVPHGVNAVKDFFSIIDMGGNVFEHGFWEQKRSFSLTHKRREEEGVPPVKICPEEELDKLKNYGCGAILSVSAAQCKHCGYIFPEPKKKPLKEADFIQLENYELLPSHLVGKKWGSMSIEELEEVRIHKKMKGLGWIVRQILLSKDLELIDYAKMKGYKYPNSWVEKMESIYLKKENNEA